MVLIITIFYLSLIMELLFFHTPSVANTHVFFTKDEAVINQYNQYQYVFKWSKGKKIILLLIPHFINVLAFFMPLLFIYFSQKTNSTFILLGTIIAIIGRLFSFISMLQIRQNNSQKNGQFTLHTSGVFSFSRNPIQLGMYVFYIGICLINFKAILALCFLFYFFYNDFRIKIEEDFLEVKFKNLYRQYKLKTRRYL